MGKQNSKIKQKYANTTLKVETISNDVSLKESCEIEQHRECPHANAYDSRADLKECKTVFFPFIY